MGSGKFRDQKWYAYAVALCIGAAFYVLLTHLNVVGGVLGKFIGYFRTVIYGCILAYLVNPLARWLENKALRGVRKEKVRWAVAVIAAVVAAILLLALLLGLLIPQLVQSVTTLAGNLDAYAASLESWLVANELPSVAELLGSEDVAELSENIMNSAMDFLGKNLKNILGAAAGAGKNVFTWGIALILSVYLLMSKTSVKAEVRRFLRAILKKERSEKVFEFFRRCDTILVSFVVDSLIESCIVGGANAVFMMLCGMQYIGLISVVVGLTNLIPTFGPIIGGVIGGFILLLVNPVHALIFLVFTLFLQFVDGYIIKPKLFGNALGVSGLLILSAVIVGGSMFGVLGVLLAIPGAAILNFVYRDYLMPALEKRQ